MTDKALSPIYERAISYMNQQGWQRLTAKSRGFEQSLFDHTRIEIDTLMQLAPILSRPNHFGLTEDELKLLVVALMAHDIGKQLPEWQDYILGRRGALSDVNRKLTADVVPTLYPALGLEPNPDAERVIENCINLHMRHERRPGNVLDAVLGARESQVRWFTLAGIVFHLDNLCSIGSVSSALAYLRDERHIFYWHLHSSHHQVNVRGVSTPMLHRAAEDAFDEKGWTPLLYFREATIYVKSAAASKEKPAQEAIQNRLSRVLQDNLQGEVAKLMVGSPPTDRKWIFRQERF
jgi:CRISPR type I-D-associated protein Csc3/Cas10d